MKLKNPILFFILLVFIIVNILDTITAFFILPGEANPLYILTGNIYVLIAIKIGIILVGVYYYKRNIYPSNVMYYSLMIMYVLATIAVSFGVLSNVQGIRNPELIEAASTIPTDIKVKTYFSMMSIVYVIPFIFSLLSFILYDKSLKYVNIDKEYYKRKKWWQP